MGPGDREDEAALARTQAPTEGSVGGEPGDQLAPGTLVGRYLLGDVLGTGGMGVVYRALDPELGRALAIKVVRAGGAGTVGRAHLLREAQTLAQLQHPNIVPIFDVGPIGDGVFAVMPLLTGGTLGHWLEAQPRAWPEVLERFVAAGRGLAAAHAAGLIHRDFKPHNVLLGARGEVQVADFGLARPGDANAGARDDGGILGTPAYMAPEQMRGERSDARADQFSFCVALWEGLFGGRPFGLARGTDVLGELLDAVTTGRIVAPARGSDVPAWLRNIVERGLRADAAARWPSMQHLLDAIAREQRPLLGVLYFENLGGAPDEEYFRDGITEDVITELSKVDELMVLPRSAVVGFRDREVSIQDIGKQLGVAYVLAGSIRRAGRRVRITAQLLDSQVGHAVWAERYDRELEDILEIQEQIARSIAHALRITLSPKEEREIAARPTGNVEAYDLYLRGRSFVRRATQVDLGFAMEMFESAIRLEPDFALAHAGLSNVCALLHDWYEPDAQWIEKGLAAASAARDHQPDLAEALAALARVCWAQRAYEDAVTHARAAIERKPDCDGAYWTLGQALFSLDRDQEVVELEGRALLASGDDYNVYIPLINAMGRLGRDADARRLRAQQKGVLVQQLKRVPEDVRARILLATSHASLGEKTEAAAELTKAVALRPHDANLLYNAACTYGVLGMPAEALTHLRAAIANGFWNTAWIARDPDLACLHGNPEFEALLAK